MLTALRHWYHDWVTHDDRSLDQIFAGRALLTDDDFYQRYFADGGVSKQVATGIRALFIAHVPLDMRHLAPDDNFGRELQFLSSARNEDRILNS